MRATLFIAGEHFDLLYCSYGFHNHTDKKGWLSSGVLGGSILVGMESTSSSTLLSQMIDMKTPFSGRIEIRSDEDASLLRLFEWEEAFIYGLGESMSDCMFLPMTLSLSITPQRLDINRHVRLDRRRGYSYFGCWIPYAPSREPARPSFFLPEEEKTDPECALFFRRRSNRAEHFGLDWLRTGDTAKDTAGDHWYNEIMPLKGQYDRLAHGEYRFFSQSWKERSEAHRLTSRYIMPWLTIKKNRVAKLRLKLEVNKPSGDIRLSISGGGAKCLSISPQTVNADRTGNYFHSEELTIACTGTFSSETYIEAFAGNVLVGKLSIIPNVNEYPIGISLIPVRITKPKKEGEKETIIETEVPVDTKDKIALFTDQAYISPTYFEHGRTLDLTEPYQFETEKISIFDKYFREGKDQVIRSRSRRTSEKLPNGLGNLRIHDFFDMMLYNQYPNLVEQFKSTYRIYFIDYLADIQGAASIANATNGSAIIFKPDGYNTPHELFHLLGLEHSFLSSGDTRREETHYYFNEGFTDNLMDYISSNANYDNRISLWYWQIKQVWRRLKAKRIE